MIKSTNCSSRGPGISSQHVQPQLSILELVPAGSDTLLQPLQVLHAHFAQDTCKQNIHTYKIKNK